MLLNAWCKKSIREGGILEYDYLFWILRFFFPCGSLLLVRFPLHPLLFDLELSGVLSLCSADSPASILNYVYVQGLS